MGDVQYGKLGKERPERPAGWFRNAETHNEHLLTRLGRRMHVSFNKYLLNIYHELGSMQSAGDTIACKQALLWLSHSWQLSQGNSAGHNPRYVFMQICMHVHTHAHACVHTHTHTVRKAVRPALRIVSPMGGWRDHGQRIFLGRGGAALKSKGGWHI